MSLKRELTTQERVDLAVKAGHWAAVTDFIRMHDGQSATGAETGNGVITVNEPSDVKTYSALPGYAFAAIDCYLTSLGIDRYGPQAVPRFPGKIESAPGHNVLTMKHLDYANHCHEQAAYFKDHQGLVYSGVLAERLEFASSYLAFLMIQDIISIHPFELHRNKIEYDDEHEVHTLTLANGRMICRAEPEDRLPGHSDFLFYLHGASRGHGEVDDILNAEINELAETLQSKGFGLQ